MGGHVHILCRTRDREPLPLADINQAGAFRPSVNSDAPSVSQMGLMQLREEVACLKVPRDSGKGSRHRVGNFQSCALTLI